MYSLLNDAFSLWLGWVQVYVNNDWISFCIFGDVKLWMQQEITRGQKLIPNAKPMSMAFYQHDAQYEAFDIQAYFTYICMSIIHNAQCAKYKS